MRAAAGTRQRRRGNEISDDRRRGGRNLSRPRALRIPAYRYVLVYRDTGTIQVYRYGIQVYRLVPVYRFHSR